MAKMSESRAMKTPSMCNAEHPPSVSYFSAQPEHLAEHSPALLSGGEALHAAAAVFLSSWH